MPALPPSPFRFALIGAGRVGTAVAVLLQRAGHTPVAVASRSASSATAAARRLKCSVAAPEEIEADVFLLGTGVEAISAVAASIGDIGGKVVIHFAGVAGIEPLGQVVKRGGFACALHPVQACPDVDIAIERLPGSAWGVTCSSGAEQWAAELIANDLDGTPVDVPEADRVLWHAAAVITSNGIAALMAAGEMMLEHVGIADAQRVLGPIAVGTATNAQEGGGGAATLTGPVVRGESDTVARHMESLREGQPHLAELYRLVSTVVIQAAEGAGRIDPAVARRMREELR